MPDAPLTMPAILSVDWASYAPDLITAALRTLQFTVAGFLGATLLGAALALMRVSSSRGLRAPALVFTEIFKNVPLLTTIFVVYYGLASVDLRLGAFASGVISMVIFYGAYLSEIYRGALLGISRGQYEASDALGLSKAHGFFSVILPQAVRLALPGTATMLVDLLKATSLFVTIAGGELMATGQFITSVTFRPLEVYVVVGIIYFLMCFPLSRLTLALEGRLNRGEPLSPRRRQFLQRARQRMDRDMDRDIDTHATTQEVGHGA